MKKIEEQKNVGELKNAGELKTVKKKDMTTSTQNRLDRRAVLHKLPSFALARTVAGCSFALV